MTESELYTIIKGCSNHTCIISCPYYDEQGNVATCMTKLLGDVVRWMEVQND